MEGKYILAGLTGIVEGLTKGLEARQKQDQINKELNLKEQHYKILQEATSAKSLTSQLRAEDLEQEKEIKQKKVRLEEQQLNQQQLFNFNKAIEPFNKRVSELQEEKRMAQNTLNYARPESKVHTATSQRLEQIDADLKKQEAEIESKRLEFGLPSKPSKKESIKTGVKLGPESSKIRDAVMVAVSKEQLIQLFNQTKQIKSEKERQRLMEYIDAQNKAIVSGMAVQMLGEP